MSNLGEDDSHAVRTAMMPAMPPRPPRTAPAPASPPRRRRCGAPRIAACLLLVLASGLATGCNLVPITPPAPAEGLEEFAPLAGNWVAVLGKPGERVAWTEEVWSRPAGHSLVGVSRTFREGSLADGARRDDAEFEFLRIVARDGAVLYIAQPQGRVPPVEFTLQTESGAAAKSRPTSWRFVNAAHDYPQVIEYTLHGANRLDVVIGRLDDVTSQRWRFERVD